MAVPAPVVHVKPDDCTYNTMLLPELASQLLTNTPAGLGTDVI